MIYGSSDSDQCLDVWDDYSAMRKNIKYKGILPQWTTRDMLDNLDEDQLNSGENFENDNHVETGEYDRIGDDGKNR